MTKLRRDVKHLIYIPSSFSENVRREKINLLKENPAIGKSRRKKSIKMPIEEKDK